MKHLHTLIKLKQNELDAMRLQISQQEALCQQLQQIKNRLIESLHLEGERVREDPMLSGDFSRYAIMNDQQQAETQQKIHIIESQLDALRDAMAVLFSEQKTYEIALERQQLAAAKAQQKREQLALDEMASQRFHAAEEG